MGWWTEYNASDTSLIQANCTKCTPKIYTPLHGQQTSCKNFVLIEQVLFLLLELAKCFEEYIF